MNLFRKHELKALGALFTICLLAIATIFALGFLVAMPLARWAIVGVLHFPTSASELWSLAVLIVSGAILLTLVLWLRGKIFGG
ncbi:hypothetical protein [Variovorax sp. MHTC-1]|uniref:hypothetical protein n=1 Tax=Variovorax sp. MHTC-1 TaxID=2495593 RepID=UPI000F896E1B|nr:hypothetical protein [Variovorax sp. MHTC-1]RST56622.1 hypothetical protein EJI01_02000 [Variovorax sp. MHTC-1]